MLLFFGAKNAEGAQTCHTARPRAAMSWSGAKDSCAALHRTHAYYDGRSHQSQASLDSRGRQSDAAR